MTTRDRFFEWADLVYMTHGRVTHVLAYAGSQPYHMYWGKALCGRSPSLNSEWLGTDSYSQMVEANRQKLCKRCEALAAGR